MFVDQVSGKNRRTMRPRIVASGTMLFVKETDDGKLVTFRDEEGVTFDIRISLAEIEKMSA